MAKVVVIASKGVTTNMLVNKLIQHHELVRFYIETAPSKAKIVKNRMKQLGFFKVLGQLFFLLIGLRFVSDRPKKRFIRQNIAIAKNLRIPRQVISSVHDPSFIEEISQIECDFVVINGTRILSSNLIDQLKVPVLNIHVGITPAYRGVHGGYWALYDNKPHLCGTTLHYVDKGIDTGSVIDQAIVKMDRKDNFKSYPLKQYLKGIEMLLQFLGDRQEKKCELVDLLSTKSKLHYHPTIIQYLSKRISKGVR